ncbi:MAG: hypothetical protein PHQ27_09695, partial [Victivallales bacterium]|nr:hypothetical protein [Victivallales bacterium]
MKRNRSRAAMVVMGGIIGTVMVTGWQLTAAPAAVKAPPNSSRGISFDSTTTMLAHEGRKLTPEQLTAWEKQLPPGAEGITAATKLLGYYLGRAHRDPETARKREKIILWLIDHHPEAGVLATPYGGLSFLADAEVKTAVKRKWAEYAARQPDNAAIFWNAAGNLSLIDMAAAEKYLQRGAELEPKNYHWYYKLGGQYTLDHKYVPALTAWRRAYELNPDVDLVLPYLTQAAFAAGDYTAARDYARKMLTAVSSGTG